MTLIELPDLIQGSDEWLEQRRGMVTASVVGKLITARSLTGIDYTCPECGALANSPCLSKVKRGGEPAAPIKTLHQGRADAARNSDAPPELVVADTEEARTLTSTLVAERITGFTEPTPMTADMWRGVEDEPRARDAYAAHFAPVRELGFMVEDQWGWRLGYSPDGLVGDDGLIEIKSRRQRGQLQTILHDDVPPWNYAQLQCGLLVSGREWIDFVSYAGGMPLYRKRVLPDQRWFDAIVAAVTQLEETATAMVATYEAATVGLPMTERIDYDAEIRVAA